MVELILFYSFSTLIVLASICVISLNNPVYNVLFLVIAFLGTAGLYSLINAQFLSMVIITIYVGAVAVFFLFVVMTLEGSGYQQKERISWPKKALGMFLGLSFAIEVSLIIFIKLNSLDLPKYKSDTPFNLKGLAMGIFQDNIHLLELLGIILLVSMIGSIIIAQHNIPIQEALKKQNSTKQNDRSREDSVTLVKVLSGKGIK
jgi:NADH-quinone oxidoreductase subunit J